MRSRVTPGVSSTMAMGRPAMRLKSVLFPTLGLPTMAKTGSRADAGMDARGVTSPRPSVNLQYASTLCYVDAERPMAAAKNAAKNALGEAAGAVAAAIDDGKPIHWDPLNAAARGASRAD